MRLNRRDFIHVCAIGTAGVAAASCGDKRPSLDIKIKGLSLIQRVGNTVTIHLINGKSVGAGEHFHRLLVPAAMIDPSTTVPHAPLSASSPLRVIELENKTVTTPATGTSAADISLEDLPIGNTLPAAGGWGSIRYSARLKTLSGATQITDTTKFYGSVQVNHGRLYCATPEDSIVGGTAVWTFKHPTTGAQVCPTQAISNVIVCKTKMNKTGAKFLIGSQELVFVPGQSGEVVIDNTPMGKGTGCGGGALLCADHLAVYYDLVNATVKPIAEGQGPPPA